MKNQVITYKIFKILGALFLWTIVFSGVFSLGVYFLKYQSLSAGKNESVFKFQNPEMFWFLVILIPFFVGSFFILFWKNKKLKQFSASSTRAGVLPTISNWSMLLKLFFMLNFIIFSIIAMANPVFGKSNSKVKTEGIEIMVALDISNSMLADDLAGGYTRLDVAKKALEELLNNLHGDKIGFVVFAGNAYLQMPMTSDYEGAKIFLNSIEPSMISNQGTNLTSAIGTAVKGFDNNDLGKTILIITDGEAHDVGAVELAQEVKEKGIIISCIGMGTKDGGMVPNYVNGKYEGYKKDENGELVITKINPALINNISVAGGGVASFSKGISIDLSEQIEHMDTIQTGELESSDFQVGISRYYIFAVCSVLCLLGFILISNLNVIKK